MISESQKVEDFKFESVESFKSIVDIVEDRAKEYPDKIAIIFNNQYLTYYDLNFKINQLAHYIVLQRQNDGGETIVCILLERSIELIISILAVLKAGAAYVPLDPHHPKQRLNYIFSDIKPVVLITNHNLKEIVEEVDCKKIFYDDFSRNIGKFPKHNVIKFPKIYSAQLAYVLYTSGSTGHPKGVMISHASLSNFLHSMASSLPLKKSDRFLSVTTPAFDISGLEYFGPLVTDGTLIIAPYDAVNRGGVLLELLEKQKPTIMQATPVTWQMLIEVGWKPLKNFKVLCGGEALTPNLFKNFLSNPIDLWNLYGPTETTIWSTLAKYTSEDFDKEIHIGYPIANTQVHIIGLDSDELCISGAGLARGYWNRPDLTAEKFTPNPFINTWSAFSHCRRLYHTGDIGVKREDGTLICLGRVDNQVKIRGYRIELEEIESVLNKHQDIRQAIVKAEKTEQNYYKLVAYIILKNRQCQSVNLVKEIKKFLILHLPEYMVPQNYKFLESFPITSNGKVDRKKIIADCEIEERDSCSNFASLSPMELLLIKIYEDEFQVKNLGIDDDLFELGLDSLTSLRIFLKLRSSHINVTERILFSCNTIKSLAHAIENDKSFFKILNPIQRLNKKLALASYAQQRLWLMDQLLPDKGFYNVSYAFRIRGSFDKIKFENAITQIIKRHEIFRTVFYEKEGQIFQNVLSEETFSYEIEDLLDSELMGTFNIEQFLVNQAKKPFDLSSAPLFRICLIRMSSEECIVSFVMHHMLIDEWAINLFFKELKDLYQNECETSFSLIQYTDFSIWQRRNIENHQFASQETFWQTQLKDINHEPLIHVDYKRIGNSGYRTKQLIHQIPLSLLLQLRRYCHVKNTTLFTALVSLLSILFYRYSNRQNVVIGSPISNRNYPEVRNLIGFFVNMISLKSSLLDDMNFEEVLSQLRAVVLDAYENQDLPFEHVVKNLNIKHCLGVHPIFQVVLILEGHEHKLMLNGLDIEEIRIDTLYSNPSSFDLTVWAKETKKGLELRFEYAEDLFDAETIKWFAKHFENIVESVLANPKEIIANIPLYSSPQLNEAIHVGDLHLYDPTDGVLERLEKYAAMTPSKIGAIYKERHLTYHELLNRVNILTNHLKSYFLELESSVCVLAERNIEFLISILAILKIGATYVPIDPTLPKERIQNILQICQPSIILTNDELRGFCEGLGLTFCCVKVIEDLLLSPVKTTMTLKPSKLPPNRLSYIIFTSGSTGIPKGVMVEHDGMVNHLYAKIKDLQLSSQDVIAQTATQAFDISIWQFLIGIFIGATTWICPTEEFWDPEKFLYLLKKLHITIAETVPSHILMVLDAIQNSSSNHAIDLDLCYLLSTGEPLHSSLTSRWFKSFPSVPIVNAYGPTECSDDVTHHMMSNENQKLNDQVSISGVVNNLNIYFLDATYAFKPYGANAELCVGGPGVCRGYLNDPEKTAVTFLPDPFSQKKGSRMYLTGDLVRVNSAKDILFLGRIDSQVKVRGYRIEIEEIEEHLETHSKVKRAKVILLNSSKDKIRIIAYMTCQLTFSNKEDQRFFVSEIREFLFQKLPSYMIPNEFKIIDHFPLNINGKIDSKQLPPPNEEESKEYTQPRNTTERLLTKLIERIVGISKFDIFDNFFDLGANSLSAISISSEIKKLFGQSISIIEIFKYPTVVELAKRIQIQPNHTSSIDLIHCHKGNEQRLFLLHASDGLTFAYSQLASLDFNFSIYSLRNPLFGQNPSPFSTMEAMARCYIDQIRGLQPHGPYYLGGWSFGGNLAFEIATQLKDLGEEIAHLFLIDSFVGLAVSNDIDQVQIDELLENYGIKKGSIESQLFSTEMKNNFYILKNYQPKVKDFNVTLFKAMKPNKHFPFAEPFNGWSDILQTLTLINLPSDHYNVFSIKESLNVIGDRISLIIKT